MIITELCNIIKNEMELAEGRIVIFSGSYNAPYDSEIFVIISQGNSKIIASKNEFDESTNEEVKTVTLYTNFTVEITSKNESAIERKEEIIMALTSQQALEIQEKESFKVFRIGDILDLTFIEGASNLYRYQIPVAISHLKQKRTNVNYYDSFEKTEVIDDE